jgi:hypothetical protein
MELPPALLSTIEQQLDLLAAIKVPANVDPPTAFAIKRAVGEAFVAGFRWVMASCSALALISALSAWVLITPRPARAG